MGDAIQVFIVRIAIWAFEQRMFLNHSPIIRFVKPISVPNQNILKTLRQPLRYRYPVHLFRRLNIAPMRNQFGYIRTMHVFPIPLTFFVVPTVDNPVRRFPIKPKQLDLSVRRRRGYRYTVHTHSGFVISHQWVTWVIGCPVKMDKNCQRDQ